jgi:hypothetical protein
MHIRQNLSTGGYDQTGTPVGALVATAVEGGVLVMNADMAVTVAEDIGAFVKAYGVTGAADLARSVYKAGIDAVTASRPVNLDLKLPPKP